MNLSQRQLRLFVVTAERLNLSQAAGVLHLSQPALSRAVQALEAQLGVVLFQRSTRRIVLTPEGERLLPVARRLLHDLDTLADELREQASGLRGRIVLAVGSAFGSTVLPAALRAFAADHPQVQVRLVDDNSAGICERVRRAEADLGIGSAVGDTSLLDCRPLLAAPLGLLGDAARFPALAAPSPRPAALAALPLLKEPDDTSIVQALRAGGSPLVSRMAGGLEVTSLVLQLAMAQAGVGVAVLSALGASHAMAAGLQFVPLRPALQREVFLLARRDRPMAPAAAALVAAIDEALAAAPLHPAIERRTPA